MSAFRVFPGDRPVRVSCNLISVYESALPPVSPGFGVMLLSLGAARPPAAAPRGNGARGHTPKGAGA